ncbi:PAS domain-containing protein [Sphingomonas piscis]|uniref:histidine kinase n=2 Tax=Sphingomonas piscis TaxID=2714943 RepID=A0A6G7YTK8_9SPHN|nr:PAS domain-containing protein [Sphingomonas piscis]
MIADAMPQIVWSTLPDGFHDYYNRQWYEFTGVADSSTDGEGWNNMFHPDDQPLAWERWRHSMSTGEPYEIEYRLRHRSGEYRWVLGRAAALRNDAGEIVRWIGTCTDIDEGKRQAEENEVLSRELSHRIKNIFAVIGGLIGLSSRNHPEAGSFASELRERIAALGRAHEYARPHSEISRTLVGESSLQGLMIEIFKPYLRNGEQAITVDGDEVQIDDRGATPMALIMHELATNSAKYGALSTDNGRVRVAIALADGELVIRWAERGGPPISGPPQRHGFGSRLVDLSVHQMGGRLDREWNAQGLDAVLTVKPEHLHR